jgi:hypothetical protein
MQEKLHDYGISKGTAAEIIADVFGKQCGSCFMDGLVDCNSESEFDKKLKELEKKWNSLESPFAPPSGPRFYNYFCHYQAEVVKLHMRRDIREAVGLGSPPLMFTTNCSESVNAALKRKVNYKEHEWPDFNEHLKELVQAQREEVIRALSDRGQYRLLPMYRYLGTSVLEWSKMQPEQRQILVASFDSAMLLSQSQPRHTPVVGETSSGTDEKKELSISPEDSGISTIPLITLQGMWSKANLLLSKKNAITDAPGEDRKARMVASLTSEVPHFIRRKTSGAFVCDNNCPRWKSANICSHTLATAEVNDELKIFLEWYCSHGLSPNITTLAMHGLPSGSGKKGGKPSRKRHTAGKTTGSELLATALQPATGNINVSQSAVANNYQVNLPPSATSADTTPVAALPPHFVSVTPLSPRYVTATPLPPRQQETSSGAAITPPNLNPFYLKFIIGNIRVCQGCHGSLRLGNGNVPAPPFDVTVARTERRSFRDPSGTLITPRRESVCHYHCRVECIKAVQPNFIPSSLIVPPDIRARLTGVHLKYIEATFDL